MGIWSGGKRAEASAAPMSDLVSRVRRKLIPAVPVPFDHRGAIDAAAQGAYAGWMARQPIGAVAVWAHTGRGLRLDDEQRHGVLSAWGAAMPDTPIICGVGVPHGVRLPAASVKRTDRVIAHVARMAEAAKRGGAAAVMVHPPTPLRRLRGLEARVLELHGAVAEVGLPVIAFYLYEAAGGVAYAPDVVGRLLASPGVIGIKLATLDSVMTFQAVAAVARGIPGTLLITGEDRFLGYSLMLGAESALIGLGAACTDVVAALLDAWFARDAERFFSLGERVDRFAAETFTAPMEGYVQRILWALEADGVLERGSRDPFAPRLPPGEHDRVVRAVRELRRL